ncbi:SDR family NAD(P)-dependent oxidoreductase [Saccharopolyspora mangrovi]|uniref:SDR family oxidoreductase n=1 Tax=Saccharopolyspora mangrovi TaxID=3082379 RepID=A0ABU6ABQ4_9PSEU|nr:SDR family oxidoreductase [Saccharopolyspora sp. S2-29]MEB3368883.1 SDR family oxidoreductase [Saccharopolyspora sp. S2-29]
MFEDLAGRVAVVTGGARGLGLTMAGALARQGVSVGLLDRLPEVAASADKLGADSGSASAGVVADVTDPGSLAAAFDQVEAQLGPATILVNSAGISVWSDAEEQSCDSWRQVLGVNLDGTFFACQELARRCKTTGRSASIVNVSSMSGSIVNVPQHQTAYTVSKAGVTMLTKSLAVEWQQLGIRVNEIAPGYFLSDMTRQFVDDNPSLAAEWTGRTPAGRLGEPSDLEGAVVYLASDSSRYVVGHTLAIDDGYTLV